MKYNTRLTSEVYLQVLQKHSSNLIDKHAIKIGLYKEGLKHQEKKRPESFLDATPVKEGFLIPVERFDGSGDRLHFDKLIIPYSEIKMSRLKANIAYIIKDVSFTEFTFPYIMAIAAGISIILQILRIME
ncbi:MAG: hypothetical protein WEA56_15635 [Balneolaceae bacterium]